MKFKNLDKKLEFDKPNLFNDIKLGFEKYKRSCADKYDYCANHIVTCNKYRYERYKKL